MRHQPPDRTVIRLHRLNPRNAHAVEHLVVRQVSHRLDVHRPVLVDMADPPSLRLRAREDPHRGTPSSYARLDSSARVPPPDAAREPPRSAERRVRLLVTVDPLPRSRALSAGLTPMAVHPRPASAHVTPVMYPVQIVLAVVIAADLVVQRRTARLPAPVTHLRRIQPQRLSPQLRPVVRQPLAPRRPVVRRPLLSHRHPAQQTTTSAPDHSTAGRMMGRCERSSRRLPFGAEDSMETADPAPASPPTSRTEPNHANRPQRSEARFFHPK